MLYLPLADVFVNFHALFLLGTGIGLLWGSLGRAAQMLTVPALTLFGFPSTFAVSTTLTSAFGRSAAVLFDSTPLTYAHRRLGLALGLFALVGAAAGSLSLMGLARLNLAIPVLYTAYGLLFLGIFIFYWPLRPRRWYGTRFPSPSWPFGGRPGFDSEHFIDFVSLGDILRVGLCSGFICGFLGLGAGLAGNILLTRYLGAPRLVALATDRLMWMFAAGSSVLTFSLAGRTEIVAVLLLMAGTILGQRTGQLLPAAINFLFQRRLTAIMCLLTIIALTIRGLGEYSPGALFFLGALMLACTCVVLGSYWNHLRERLGTRPVKPRPQQR
ncbi:TSUP family transporter [Desulfofundulus thermobenzoicus]|uniref:Probable membrane transporter protein n=1 Tax=Desulfofundulus thermobenzoicus TaxID=29376 RepID=A0A6N7ISJ2_9FIRM|nr:TSUP family transporter [Desulfofundulus thermobenzoicus]